MATATTNLTLTNLAYVSERYPSTHYILDSNTWYVLGESWDKKNYMFTKLEAFPAAYKHNQLLGIQFRVRIRNDGAYQHFEVYRSEDYDAATITWYTMPRREMDFVVFRDVFYTGTGDRTLPDTLNGTNDEKRQAYRTLNCESLCVAPPVYSDFEIKTTLSDSTPIYAIVSYDDAVIVTSEIAYRSGPQSGYANPRNAITFSWDYDATDYCADPTWGQTSATFYWKKSSDAGYTAVSAGTAKSVNIAANTFPTAETISWYVVGTDDEGTTSQTEVFSFSTAAGTAAATPNEPINTFEDGSSPIIFGWTLISTDGQEPSRVEAEWKKSTDDSWTTLVDESSPISQYAAAGGTFPAGSIDWRVRAYNIDGTAGPWSDSVTFICETAPDPVEGLAATAVPMTEISWQSAEQEAYEISIDGEVVQKAYGAGVYSWTVPQPLSDGRHEISVRVQGVYGLWSQPSVIAVTVANAPEIAMTLSAVFGLDAELVVTPEDDAEISEIYWYRDDIPIGKTTGSLAFTDRLSLGSHVYFAEVRHSSGNISRSNSVGGVTAVSGVMIAAFSGGSWIDIRRSENSRNTQDFSWSQETRFIQITGACYPIAEVSPYETETGSYNCAFSDPSSAAEFLKLKGMTVIVKSRRNNVLVGVLTQIMRVEKVFYESYNFTLQRINWEDFVEDDQGN